MSDDLHTWVRDHQHRYPQNDTPATRARGAHTPLIRATLTRALATGSSVQDARTALLRAGVELPQRRVWLRLVNDAVTYSLSSSISTPGGARAARLKVARQLVARVLTPVDPKAVGLSRQRVLACRRAVAVIAAQALRDVDAGKGDGTCIVTASWLALQLGCTQRTAHTTLASLRDDLRWVRRVKKLPGGVWVYRLTRLSVEAVEVCAAFADTCALIADGNGSGTPLAAALMSADHPVFGYSEDVPSAAWLVRVGMAAGLKSKHLIGLGVPARQVVPAREWLASGVLEGLETDAARLREARLTELRAASKERQQVAASMAAEKQVGREARAKAGRWLRAKVGDQPGTHSTPSEVTAWLQQVAAESVKVRRMDAQFAGGLWEVIVAALGRAGVGADKAQIAADRILGDRSGGVAAA